MSVRPASLRKQGGESGGLGAESGESLGWHLVHIRRQEWAVPVLMAESARVQDIGGVSGQLEGGPHCHRHPGQVTSVVVWS